MSSSSKNNLAERDKFLDKIQKEIIEKKNVLIEMHNYNKNKNKMENKDYIHSQLINYEKQLEKLRNLLYENDLLSLEKKEHPSILKEIKRDQTDIYAEISKIEKEINKIS